MSTSDAVDYKFKNFNVDNKESNVYKEVQDGGNGPFKHFLLTKGNQKHVFEPFTRSIIDKLILSKINVRSDSLYPLPGKKCGCCQYDYEKDLLHHSLIGC